MPYISASIIMQLMTYVVPTFEQLKKEGEAGRQKDYSVHPLRHIGLGLVSVPGHCCRAGVVCRFGD
jgi:preprotein translocase subunit SecY